MRSSYKSLAKKASPKTYTFSESNEQIPSTLASRIVRLEVASESTREELHSLRGSIESLGERLEAEFKTLRDSTRPNYAIWVSLASVCVLLLFGLGSAAYVPVWITTKNINDKAQSAVDWQKDYQLGKIPSSADPALERLRERFVEVESQFKSTDELRNVQFAEIQRVLANLQNTLHDMKAPLPASPGSPFYEPHVARDHNEN